MKAQQEGAGWQVCVSMDRGEEQTQALAGQQPETTKGKNSQRQKQRTGAPQAWYLAKEDFLLPAAHPAAAVVTVVCQKLKYMQNQTCTLCFPIFKHRICITG